LRQCKNGQSDREWSARRKDTIKWFVTDLARRQEVEFTASPQVGRLDRNPLGTAVRAESAASMSSWRIGRTAAYAFAAWVASAGGSENGLRNLS
jgi:hypothetical protein